MGNGSRYNTVGILEIPSIDLLVFRKPIGTTLVYKRYFLYLLPDIRIIRIPLNISRRRLGEETKGNKHPTKATRGTSSATST